MFRIQRSKPWPPAIDLGTVRDTLQYMHDDMHRVPGMEKVAAALEQALAEVDAADKAAGPPSLEAIDFARFLPRRN